MSNNDDDDDDDEESITITTEENPMDVSFRDPSGTAFAVGLITGGVEMWRRTTVITTGGGKGRIKKQSTIQAHSESVRALSYMRNGDVLVTGSGDCSVMLIDSTTEQAIGRSAEAHEQAITRLTVLDNANIIATGCDEGVMKIWDVREEDACIRLRKTRYL